MVRSKSVSGVGLVAFCESLETRSLFTAAAIDTVFKGGVITTHFSGDNEAATAATVLKSGKLLVGGVSTMGGRVNDVLAVYNPDGQLSNSFSDDGKAILDPSIVNEVGATEKVLATPDGGVIVAGKYGLIKLLANGRIDTTYGENGFARIAAPTDVAELADAKIDATGAVRVLSRNFTRGAISAWDYTPAGRISGVTSASNDELTRFLPDGKSLGFSYSNRTYTVRRLTTNLLADTTFGNDGFLDIGPAYDAWLAANGPFNINSYHSDDPDRPLLTVRNQTVNADGSLLLEALVGGKSSKVSYPNNGGATSLVFITIDSAGKTATFKAGPDTDGATIFDGYFFERNATTQGVFYGDNNSPLTVSLRTDPSASNFTYLSGSLTAADGSVFVYGRDTQVQRNGFVVAKLKPLNTPVTPPPASTGSISGVLFNDDNGDQIKQADETINAGRVVYIDANNNNKLDAGERRVTTDVNGRYVLGDLAPGTYRVRRVLPNGYQTTTYAATYIGGGTTVTSGANVTLNIGSTARALVRGAVFVLDSAGNRHNIDQDGTIFADLNKNGRVDAGEPSYTFRGSYILSLQPGSYRIAEPVYSGYKPYSFPAGYIDVKLGSGANMMLDLGYKAV